MPTTWLIVSRSPKKSTSSGIYAQGAPLRGLPAKRRDFAVDYVEGEGDIVPDSARREEGGWRPDDRDTAITIQNPVHDGEKYREALEREGHSNAVFGGMRAAMDGKEYVLGEAEGYLGFCYAGRIQPS